MSPCLIARDGSASAWSNGSGDTGGARRVRCSRARNAKNDSRWIWTRPCWPSFGSMKSNSGFCPASMRSRLTLSQRLTIEREQPASRAASSIEMYTGVMRLNIGQRRSANNAPEPADHNGRRGFTVRLPSGTLIATSGATPPPASFRCINPSLMYTGNSSGGAFGHYGSSWLIVVQIISDRSDMPKGKLDRRRQFTFILS